MDRCNELCTKDAIGTCALCEALAERDRFLQFWLKGGLLLDGIRALKRGRVFPYLRRYTWLMVRLRDRSKAPRCWWYPVPCTEVRHQDVVREAHKHYSESLNKTMLVLLGVALFCLLTTIGSPDKLLLASDSTIKVPFADTSLPFLGFIVVAPFLLVVLVIYLHVFYGYWLDCERERQYINQRLTPPIESLPTLFSFPTIFPRMVTGFIFYWLAPLVLGVITFKAWARPAMGLPLTYVSGVVTFVLVFLQLRRHPDRQRKWGNLKGYTTLLLIIGLMVGTTIYPQLFQRPLNLFRVEIPKAWLVGINMRRASAGLTNFQEANFQEANLQGADLQGANLRQANLQGADLRHATLYTTDLRGANLQGADLRGADIERADFLWSTLQHAQLQRAQLQHATLQHAQLQGAQLQHATLQHARLPGAQLQGANLQGADLEGASFHSIASMFFIGHQIKRKRGDHPEWIYNVIPSEPPPGTNLRGANLRGTNLIKTTGLTQDQVDMTCVDEDTKLPEGLTKPAPCPVSP